MIANNEQMCSGGSFTIYVSWQILTISLPLAQLAERGAQVRGDMCRVIGMILTDFYSFKAGALDNSITREKNRQLYALLAADSHPYMFEVTCYFGNGDWISTDLYVRIL